MSFRCVHAGKSFGVRLRPRGVEALRRPLFWRISLRTKPRFSGGESAGFTLLELLITIALIGLLASVLIVGSTRLLTEQPITPEDIFRKAVSEARKYAVENNTDVRLAYSAKDKMFSATSNAGSRTYPVTGPDDMAFTFLPAEKGNSSVMIAGTVIETGAVPFVNFYNDGTCTPFRVQIQLGGSYHVISFDPWTCAPILESNTPTP